MIPLLRPRCQPRADGNTSCSQAVRLAALAARTATTVGDLRGRGQHHAGNGRHARAPVGMATPAPAGRTSASAPAPQSAGPPSEITDFAFAPITLTVPVGATVTWTNHDEEPHTVVANDGSFHSPGMDTDGTYQLHLHQRGDLRLHLLDPPVHARHRGGDQMTGDTRSAGHDATPADAALRLVRCGRRADRGRRRGDLARRRVAPARPHRRRSAAGICASSKSATATSVSRAPPTRTSPDTFTHAIDQINGLGYTPDFVIHTGDLTHLATPEQFDQVKQMMTGIEHPARVHRSR